MQTYYQITKSEREIMEILWERHGCIKTKELFDKMTSQGKYWKSQILNTLLLRLEENKKAEIYLSKLRWFKGVGELFAVMVLAARDIALLHNCWIVGNIVELFTLKYYNGKVNEG